MMMEARKEAPHNEHCCNLFDKPGSTEQVQQMLCS